MSEDEGGFTEFINEEDDSASSVPLADADNPVNWGQLGSAIVSGFAASVFLGVNRIVRGFRAMFVDPLTGAVEWLTGTEGDPLAMDGVIGLLFGPFVDAADDVWSIDLEPFGMAAFPVAVALVVVVLWVFARARVWITERGLI